MDSPVHTAPAADEGKKLHRSPMGLMSLYFVGLYTTQLAVFPCGVSTKVTLCVETHRLGV